MQKNKCKICRRLGTKLFLKGEKCSSPKCPMVRKPYPPGFQGKKRRRKTSSEYARQLSEKQKLKHWYNLKEYQLKSYVKDVLDKRGRVGDAQGFFIKTLEKRLDNVVFRLGLAPSRAQARQLVSHGHFLVNNKKTNIPSYRVKKGDRIKIAFPRKMCFHDLPLILKKHHIPSWLSIDIKKMEAEVIAEPSHEEALLPVEVSVIFEYYSR